MKKSILFLSVALLSTGVMFAAEKKKDKKKAKTEHCAKSGEKSCCSKESKEQGTAHKNDRATDKSAKNDNAQNANKKAAFQKAD